MTVRELKDGSISADPRLDRLEHFDPRSRAYPIVRALPYAGGPALRPRSYTWRITKREVLNQGSEGACVGHAVTNELLARPAETRFGGFNQAQRFAREQVYWEAQKIDPWPGGAYPGADPFYEGTSILAGVKVAQRLGYFKEYRWAFGLRDLALGVGYNGPALIGVPWYDSMYTPDENNFILPMGRIVGGHAILVRAIKMKFGSHKFSWWKRTWEDVDLDESYVTLRNSWGGDYGNKGDCYMTLRNLGALLDQRGEAVFFLNRTSNPR